LGTKFELYNLKNGVEILESAMTLVYQKLATCLQVRMQKDADEDVNLFLNSFATIHIHELNISYEMN
jgi:hypothetical protein